MKAQGRQSEGEMGKQDVAQRRASRRRPARTPGLREAWLLGKVPGVACRGEVRMADDFHQSAKATWDLVSLTGVFETVVSVLYANLEENPHKEKDISPKVSSLAQAFPQAAEGDVTG